MSAVHPVTARVLVVGDANPDLVLQGDVVPRFGQSEQLLDAAAFVIGGAAAITAHAFARLGRPVSLVAAVGDDEFGARICRDLAGAGVAVDTILRRVDQPTGLTIVLSRANDRAILTLPGAIPTLSAADVRQAVAATRPSGLRHVHVSSLFLQPSLARELAGLLAEFRASGMTTSLDTNHDPSGTWRGVEELLVHVDVLMPNRVEVVAMGGADDPRRAAAHLAGRGPLVVVKDGARGAFAATPAGQYFDVAGEACEPVDTTGAGDTFDAAFLDSWLDARPLVECLRRAALAGALAVTELGGTAGQPTSEDLSPVGRTS